MPRNTSDPPELARGVDWQARFVELSARDQRTPLEPADLERLGFAAYLAGHDASAIEALTRAHNLALGRGDPQQAARFAFWISFA